MTETEAPPPPPSHLSQPLLTLGVSGGNQRLLGLVNEKHRALHDVTSRVQHGGCSLWVCGGGRNPAGRLGQSFQGLGRLSGCYSCTHREQTSGKSGAMEAELWLFVTTASLLCCQKSQSISCLTHIITGTRYRRLENHELYELNLTIKKLFL